MTPAEFEAIAAPLGQLEDYLRDHMHGLTPAQREPWATALRLAIAAHAQAQLLLEPSEDGGQ